METELWSIQEKMVYTESNTKRLLIGGVYILATPKGEPLTVRIK